MTLAQVLACGFAVHRAGGRAHIQGVFAIPREELNLTLKPVCLPWGGSEVAGGEWAAFPT